MSENWSKEELEAAVVAYIDMRNKELSHAPFTKKEYYVSLAAKYGRNQLRRVPRRNSRSR